MERRSPYEVVVVGGGPAGLSAGLVLGRARRSVLIVDAGSPANAVSESIGGLVGGEGISPSELRRIGTAEVLGHPSVVLQEGEIRTARSGGPGFRLTVDEEPIETRLILLAHGLVYEPPAIEGLEALWGASVFHCPFCDGWELRDRPLGVYGSDQAAVTQALVLSGLSDDVTLFSDGADISAIERSEALGAAGVRVRSEAVLGLEGSAGQLGSIVLDGAVDETRAALFVVPEVRQPSPLAQAVGCELTDLGLIATDPDGRTTVPGAFAAGDAANSLRSVPIAIGTGARAAKAMVLDLAQRS